MVVSASDVEDLSASETLIAFDPPIPLLRGPLPAGLSDDPSIGAFVLAFKDARSWKSALQACESKILEQCEAGARIGCSVSASSKCRPPWWKTLFGGATLDFSERERCEEREMLACLAASKDSCLKFAKDKCLAPFQDARISLIDQKEIFKFIFQASPKSTAGCMSSQPIGARQLPSCLLSKCNLEVTSYRGSTLLCSEENSENSVGEGGSRSKQGSEQKISHTYRRELSDGLTGYAFSLDILSKHYYYPKFCELKEYCEGNKFPSWCPFSLADVQDVCGLDASMILNPWDKTLREVGQVAFRDGRIKFSISSK